MVFKSAMGARRVVGLEYLPGLSRPPCGLAVDIDGTLTVERRRGDFRLDLEAVSLLRELDSRGIPVMLVTGNALPVAAGLGRYLGFRGPHVAENGCLLYYEEHPEKIIELCENSTREAAEIVEEELGDLLEPSWQNRFRLYDYAFTLRRGSREDLSVAVEKVKRLLGERGFGWIRVESSGYAVHLRPREASKGRAVVEAARLLGLSRECVLGVGDSATDVDMALEIPTIAVGNADPRLKERAILVLRNASGRGVVELALAILSLMSRGMGV